MMLANGISRRYPRILLLFAAILSSAPQIGRPSDDDDAPVEAGAADVTGPQIINNQALLKVKRSLALSPRRNRLDEILSWKIEDIELFCQMTIGEKEKLRLAGQGDIKRFLDRVQELETSLDAKADAPLADNVVREWDALKRLMTSGIFEDGSLFCKTRRQILTAEQLAKLEAASEQTASAWMTDFQGAQAQASKLNRPVLIHFGAKWCAPSQKVERVMESAAVMRVLRRKFVLVSVDVDQNPAVVKQFKIQNIPCELVVNDAGEIVCRSEGLKDELEFLQALHVVKNDRGLRPEVAPTEKRAPRAE